MTHLLKRIISVPISFEPVQSAIVVKEGEDITIPCEVYGLPEPTVHWYFDDNNLAESFSSEFS
jgi:Immunoglobulin domain